MLSICRRKGFFTLVFLLFCLIYFNWLVNISNWRETVPDDHSVPGLIINNDQNNKMSRLNQNYVIYEFIEGFKIAELPNTNQEQQPLLNSQKFVLLSAKNSIIDNVNNYALNSNSNQMLLDKNEFSDLIKFLYVNRVFLIDVNILKEVKFKDTTLNEQVSKPQLSTQFKYDIFNLDKLNKTYDKSSTSSSSSSSASFIDGQQQPLILNFGVFLDSFNQLNKNLYKNLNKKCTLVQSYGTFNGEKILTSFYIECKSLTIQISIVYERSSFLWIGEDNYHSEHTRLFGDTARALSRFDLAKLIDQDLNQFYVPSNFERFIFDYDHSKFLECNKQMANENMLRMGPSYKQNIKRNKMISKVTEHISETLESFNKHYWLAGGTLLGWYRDCGIIPHTQDVDLAIWASEYEKKIKNHFLGNKIVRVWGILGLVNDSYEFRLFNDQFTFDMFLVYNLNETHQWCGYQVNRVKFRRFLPKFTKLCSAELLNHKYMVPCDPVMYLDKEYGPGNWHSPQSKNYTWTNVQYWKNWSDTEWPRAVKYFDKNGDLINNKILSYINKHMSYNLTEIPKEIENE